jgi:TonB family protein
VIKAACVLLVTLLIVPRLRSRSAAERHVLWAAAVALAALVPPLAALLPAWQPQWVGTVMTLVPFSLDRVARWTGTPTDAVIVRATGLEADSWMSVAAPLIWAGGALLVGGILVAQWLRLSRLGSSAERVGDPRMLRLCTETAQASGLRRRPLLLQSARVAVPLTWGAWRPRVLLPAGAAAWTDERLIAVLTHELAHIRRGDWAVHMLAEAVCAVYWFNPLFWTARNELRRESERAADDVVLSAGIDGRDYAALLLEIVRGARRQAPAGSVAMAHPSDLSARIASLVATSANRRAVRGTTAFVVMAMIAVAALPLGALRARGVAAFVQVRTASLPKTLLAAVTTSSDAAATAVRNIRLASSEPRTIVAPAVIEYTTPPLYSDDARQRGIEGVVVIQARIDVEGRVQSPRVREGLGFGLDQNAIVALRQWRFRPAMRNGLPVAADTEIEIEFTLRQEALNELIANDMATQVGPGVTPPRAVFSLQPPPSPRGPGRVVLDVVLLEDGRPKIVRVLRSAGPELDDSAILTFEQWRFSPAVRDGRPVKVRMTAEVNFHD